jgi:hypothetical protein
MDPVGETLDKSRWLLKNYRGTKDNLKAASKKIQSFAEEMEQYYDQSFVGKGVDYLAKNRATFEAAFELKIKAAQDPWTADWEEKFDKRVDEIATGPQVAVAAPTSEPGTPMWLYETRPSLTFSRLYVSSFDNEDIGDYSKEYDVAADHRFVIHVHWAVNGSMRAAHIKKYENRFDVGVSPSVWKQIMRLLTVPVNGQENFD